MEQATFNLLHDFVCDFATLDVMSVTESLENVALLSWPRALHLVASRTEDIGCKMNCSNTIHGSGILDIALLMSKKFSQVISSTRIFVHALLAHISRSSKIDLVCSTSNS